MIHPEFCILFYKEKTNLSEDLKYYLELGKFVNEKVVSLSPLSNKDIKEMTRILNKEKAETNPSFNYINKHVIFKSDTHIVWYADNVPNSLFYLEGKKLSEKKVKMPKVLFGYNYSLNNFFVYFLKKEVGINSLFYKPNVPNYGNSVCTGRNKIVGNNENEVMNRIEQIFFKSPFTNKIENIHKWKKQEINLKTILGLK